MKAIAIATALLCVVPVFLGSAALAAEPSPPPRPSIVSSDTRTIFYRGELEPSAVAEFVALLDSKPRPIVITSGGGDEFASMTMAEAILRHGVPIRIEGYCLSGCANAVMIAARSRTIAPGSIIGLHGSAVASLARYTDIGRAPPPGMRQLVQRYERLYDAKGASLDLLSCAADQIEMTHRLYSPPGNSDPAKEGWLSRYVFWLPSAEELGKFGIDVVDERKPAHTAQERDELLSSAGAIQPASWARIRWENDAGVCP